MKQFLKKIKRFIMHYWLSISLGMITLKHFIRATEGFCSGERLEPEKAMRQLA